MAKRIQLKQTSYLPLGGQWQIVCSGSVIDVIDALPIDVTLADFLAEAADEPLEGVRFSAVRSVRNPNY